MSPHHPINDLAPPKTVDPDAMTRGEWLALAQGPQERHDGREDATPHPKAENAGERRRAGANGPSALLAALTSRPKWQERANCRDMDVNAFFPTRGEPAHEAHAACDRCPVAAECLEHAVAWPEKWGVWGGSSERARRPLRAAHNRALQAEREAS